jgi:tripartite-type tricarboxylate transporter receptor subunit TctC
MKKTFLQQRRSVLAAVAAFPALAAMRSVRAETYPTRPVTLIVPWPAGGATDAVMRTLAQAASKSLGQPVVIDNRAGATGTLGPSAMAGSARPDGYTISQMPMGVYRVPLLQKVNYDPVRDFSYIIRLTGYTQGIVCKPNRWSSFNELVTYARAHPGALTYGTGGTGSSPHIAMEQIFRELKVTAQHVPFKGGTEALNAVLGEHVDLMAGETIWAPQVQARVLRLIVTWSPKRSTLWPDVPTLKEVGVDLVSTAPYGLAGPAGMAPTVVKTLHDVFRAALDDPSVVATLERLGQENAYLDTRDYLAWAQAQPQEQKRLLGIVGLLEQKP